MCCFIQKQRLWLAVSTVFCFSLEYLKQACSLNNTKKTSICFNERNIASLYISATDSPERTLTYIDSIPLEGKIQNHNVNVRWRTNEPKHEPEVSGVILTITTDFFSHDLKWRQEKFNLTHISSSLSYGYTAWTNHISGCEYRWFAL